MGPFWIDLDLLTHLLNARYRMQSDTDWLSQLRLTLGFRLLPQISLYAGPTLDLLTSKVRKETGHVLSLWQHSTADLARARGGQLPRATRCVWTR